MSQHIFQLNKHIGQALSCTRRAADRLIEEGKVFINGKPAKGNDKVFFGDEVIVEDKILPSPTIEHPVVLAFHKPLGIDGSAAPKAVETLRKLLAYPTLVYPIGRLGAEAQGLLLLSNDPNLASQFNKHLPEKEYVVSTEKKIGADFLEKIQNGIAVLGKTTENCQPTALTTLSFSVALKDEINKQLSETCAALGNPATSINRKRVLNIVLGDLKAGDYRELNATEIEQLKSELEKSPIRMMAKPIFKKQAKVAPPTKTTAATQPTDQPLKPKTATKKTAAHKKPADPNSWFINGPIKKSRRR